jgi:hypothetical protein
MPHPLPHPHAPAKGNPGAEAGADGGRGHLAAGRGAAGAVHGAASFPAAG